MGIQLVTELKHKHISSFAYLTNNIVVDTQYYLINPDEDTVNFVILNLVYSMKFERSNKQQILVEIFQNYTFILQHF